MQQRKYESWVKKIEEINQRQVDFWQCTLHNSTNAAFEWKLSCFPILPGSAEAQIIWGGILKRLLIAYFILTIMSKNIKIRSSISEL